MESDNEGSDIFPVQWRQLYNISGVVFDTNVLPNNRGFLFKEVHFTIVGTRKITDRDLFRSGVDVSPPMKSTKTQNFERPRIQDFSGFKRL
jgi:hypothetical protein